MRGEHVVMGNNLTRQSRSSPHARGTRDFLQICAHFIGIIPACAGNTRDNQGFITVFGDHPRMRGEHVGRLGSCIEGKGSSPHARGTLIEAAPCILDIGIIPACAGNTCFG